MSLNGTVFRTGQTAGPALLGIIYIYRDIKGLFFASAILMLLAFFITLLFVQNNSITGSE
jgi:predicted MFS family arabinose efflux permease